MQKLNPNKVRFYYFPQRLGRCIVVIYNSNDDEKNKRNEANDEKEESRLLQKISNG